MFSIECHIEFAAAHALCLVFPLNKSKRVDLFPCPPSLPSTFGRMFVNPQAKRSAKAFALLGTQRMAPPHSCFPSDHFGMDARFEW